MSENLAGVIGMLEMNSLLSNDQYAVVVDFGGLSTDISLIRYVDGRWVTVLQDSFTSGGNMFTEYLCTSIYPNFDPDAHPNLYKKVNLMKELITEYKRYTVHFGPKDVPELTADMIIEWTIENVEELLNKFYNSCPIQNFISSLCR